MAGIGRSVCGVSESLSHLGQGPSDKAWFARAKRKAFHLVRRARRKKVYPCDKAVSSQGQGWLRDVRGLPCVGGRGRDGSHSTMVRRYFQGSLFECSVPVRGDACVLMAHGRFGEEKFRTKLWQSITAIRDWKAALWSGIVSSRDGD